MFADVPIPYEEALDRAGHGKLQRWITFAGAMCLLCSYLAVSMVSFVLPLSQCDLELTSQGKGAIIASGFIGIILSSHLWGFLSDTLGRRYILMRCLLADGILYILTSFVPNYWLFLIMRLFNGFSSCGGVVSAYAYVGEFHTNKHRTRSIMTASVIATLIYFILPCVAWLICPLEIKVVLFHGLVYKSWRLFYTICGIPSLLTSLLLVLLPESPKFLLANGEKEKAIEVLQYIYAENTGKPAEDFVIMNVVIDENEKIAQTYDDSKHSIGFFDSMYKQTAPLFKKPLSFNFTLLCTMQFILYFCNNGMFLWVPETVNRLAQYKENNPDKPGTFCQAVENYRSTTNNKLTSPTINEFNHTFFKHYEPAMNKFQPVKCDDSVDYSVYISSAVLGLLTGFGVIVIIFVMKIFSRKIVLAGLVMSGATATIIVIFSNHIDYVFPVTCIMIVVIGTGIPVVTSILVDFFPTNLRAMAVCISLLTGRLGTIVSSQIVGSVLDTQCNIFLYCFVGLLLFCALLVTFLSNSPPTYKPKEKTYEAANMAYQA